MGNDYLSIYEQFHHLKRNLVLFCYLFPISDHSNAKQLLLVSIDFPVLTLHIIDDVVKVLSEASCPVCNILQGTSRVWACHMQGTKSQQQESGSMGKLISCHVRKISQPTSSWQEREPSVLGGISGEWCLHLTEWIRKEGSRPIYLAGPHRYYCSN